MNRTVLLSIIVVLLGAGAYLATRFNDDNMTSVVGADREFAVPRDQVYKVFIADRQGNASTLTRTPDGWMYNNTYKARPDAIENLLSAIEQIRMQFKPTESAVPQMVQSLATSGLKVEIYDKNDTRIKSYYIGGATNDETGTYIILDGAEQPYVAELSAWKGNLRFRYNLTGDDWRDRTVFDNKFDDIKSISVDYPAIQDKSFVIQYTDNGAEVTPFYPFTPAIPKKVKKASADAYRGNFERIVAASFNNQYRDKATISKQIPFAVITLEEKSGKRQSLRLFPIYPEAFTDPKTGVTLQPEEITGYFALTESGDFMMMQNQVIAKILWAYDYFFE